MSLNAKGFIGNPSLVADFVEKVIPYGAFPIPTLYEFEGSLERFLADPRDEAGETMEGVDFSGVREVLAAIRKALRERDAAYQDPENPKPMFGPFGPPPTEYRLSDTMGNGVCGVVLSPENLASALSALSFLALVSLPEATLESLMEEGYELEPGAEYDRTNEGFILPSEPMGPRVRFYEAAEFGSGLTESVAQYAKALRVPLAAVRDVTIATNALLLGFGFALAGPKADEAVRALYGARLTEADRLSLDDDGSNLARALRSFAEVSRAVKAVG